jgi:PTH1 family peptidyl-tRNA hydrolase
LRIIFGLGNPDPKYELTRHNAGWLAVENFARTCSFPGPDIRFRSFVAGPLKICDEDLLIVRPRTYMNRSGYAVRAFSDFYDVPPEKMIIVYDDVALKLGRLRLRQKGSAGGHNGLKSVIAALGTDEVPRLRIGVRTDEEIQDLVEFVLDPFTKSELVILDKVLDETVAALKWWLSTDIQTAMSRINSIDLSG